MRVGILTSGGDCQALNATMRGLVKALYQQRKEIIGFLKGYQGLMYEKYKKMSLSDFEDILNVGGTILGSSRCPFKKMRVIEDGFDKVEAMKKTYKKLKLDCLVVLGGNGSHKTANLLSEKGLNIVTLPKTIDNDINGTDMTFGFQSAIDIATRTLDELHTTAKSHGRIIIAEIMGNKAGWLTLYSGIAGKADVILIPEIPYNIEKISQYIKDKLKNGRKHIILAVAEGIISQEETKLSKKELKQKRAKDGYISAGYRLEAELSEKIDGEVRVVVPGHIQRGGNPCAFDRVLTSRIGVKGAELILNKQYGRMVAVQSNNITSVPLSTAVEKPKRVDPNDEIIRQVRMLGICLGD